LLLYFKPVQAHPPMALGAQLGFVFGMQVGRPTAEPARRTSATGPEFRMQL
jgi:hypothetical protein